MNIRIQQADVDAKTLPVSLNRYETATHPEWTSEEAATPVAVAWPARSVAPDPAPCPASAPVRKALIGVDVFVHWRGQQVRALAETMRCAQGRDLELTMIMNRGVKVWPGGIDETLKIDHWRCRYVAKRRRMINHAVIADLQMNLAYLGIDFIKTENLYVSGDDPGFAR